MKENRTLLENLTSYKKKYFQSRLIKGSILFVGVVTSVLIFASFIEFNLRLDSLGRGTLFFVIILSLIGSIWWLVGRNLLNFIQPDKKLTNEEAADQIGDFFDNVDDRLTNTLQLLKHENQDGSLVAASIDQRNNQLGHISFSQAIDLKINWQYVKWISPVLAVFVAIWLWKPAVYLDSTERIINYDQHFAPKAPFTFEFSEENLTCFRNEDFLIELNLTGNSIPNESFIVVEGRKIRMAGSRGAFSYAFNNIQRSQKFLFEAAGFRSKEFSIKMIERPELSNMTLHLRFPKYLNRDAELKQNTGNVTVPTGTEITWEVNANYADKAEILIENSPTESMKVSDNQLFRYVSTVSQPFGYEIELFNENGSNQEKLNYKIETIEDEWPEIQVEFFSDTVLYEYVIISGRASDDYGISNISIHSSANDNEESRPIPLNNQKSQSFYYRYSLDSLTQSELNEIEFFASVRDNDGVKGRKKTESQRFRLKIPDESLISKTVNAKSEKTESELEKSIEENKDLNEKLEDLEERLRSKKELGWQEEKLIQDILDQKSELQKSIEELQKEFEQLNQMENKFNERSEPIREKAEQLQNLMNEMLDEETRKLYEELEKLLQEKSSLDDIRRQLDNIMPNESDIERELERALELFKRLKLESELEKASNDLQELADEQKQLSKQSEDNDIPDSEIKEQQEEINESFEELEKKLEDIQQQNQELQRPEPLEDTNDLQEDINNSLDEIQQEMENGDRQNGSQKQQKAGNQMQQLGEQLAQMQAGMQMEAIMANIEDLKNILDDLIKVSYRQEDLIKEFKEVRQVDPRFVDLSQDQLKLKDDVQVLDDSLTSLANRAPMISSFVTKELSDMGRHVDEAIYQLRERSRSRALTNQQYAMTSMNNLALLLDDILDQMQQSANSGGSGSDGQQQSLPNMQQLQQQLSQQIEDLKKGQMKGRQLSEELAKMAAQQEAIRNELQRLQEELNGQEGMEGAQDNLGKAIREMEQNEIDLVNKRITQQLIQRQESIRTRMLAAEDAMKEQEMDDERKGETAQPYEQRIPKAFEDYLKAKEQEIELLKTVPLDLHPFYKKEVNEYFRRLSSDN